MAKPPRITVYTTRQCRYCNQVKDFLRNNRIPFGEQDVEKNRRAFMDFQRLGGRGVPMTVIGKEKINGFDLKRLKRALQKAGFTLS